MEFRSLDITVISAEDLKNVNLFCRMAVYAVVSVEKTKCKTHADREGGKNPRWSHRVKFSVDTAAAARNPNLVLIFKLRSENLFFGHRDVGKVVIPVANLLAPIATAPSSSSSFSPTNREQVVDYQVRTPAGKPKGTLKFAYKFGDKPKTGESAPLPTPTPKATAPPPCSSISPPYNVLLPPPQPLYPLVYPQHHPPLGYGYPLPQPPMPQGYGPGLGPGPSYGYMPPPGYGGYGLERPQESRSGGGGSLMGAGLGLGLVGGMLMGG
ncbi:protein SRC2 homolog [Actinidia eriantha]|uniref:protein SRC2 homolog n=1 Tax=Actinidia eriantha TaxID=165200 RepID=UPI0025862B4D|nr:protein SRC2 homolog [Actinidia eriantha]